MCLYDVIVCGVYTVTPEESVTCNVDKVDIIVGLFAVYCLTANFKPASSLSLH